MKATLALCALLVVSAWAIPFQNDEHTDEVKEEAILKLLVKVNEPLRKAFTKLHEGSQVDPAGYGSFKDGGAAVAALNKEIADHRVLEKHHWFSLFNTRQREEALMLFDVLMNAKDFKTFAGSAAYYRERMNEGEFVYALYVAVTHSDLTSHVTLPPLYEVTPHMFTNSEVIQEAYSAKMRQQAGSFKMSFTGTKRNPEQRVAYFGEDIGLNVHHVTWHMDYPFWWDDSYGYHLDRKGELFFWAHHQLTARFDAERLSNNLDVVDELYWDREIKEGFAPHTSYKYGGGFPSRPDNVHFEDVDGVAKIRDLIIIENRIKDGIAHGYIVDKDGAKINIRDEHGIDVLGDIIESSLYSPNVQYYGALHNTAHIVLGRQADPHGKYNMPPGVMEHFETATRDPSFFRLHKYMDNIFKEHKDSLPPYTADDISFPGVAVDSVAVKGDLETHFEDFEFSLLHGVDDTEDIDDVPISAVVSRLAHSPFSYEIHATNNNGDSVLATVRIALCPALDHNGIRRTMDQSRWGCIEVDKFWQNLSPGANTIHRDSSASSVTVPDVPSFEAMLANPGGFSGARSCGIPNRMLLPKGKPEGMPFVLAVALTDGSADAAFAGVEKGDLGGTHAQCGVHGEKYPDKRPLGFPLDRRIPDDRVFTSVPNVHRELVTITHKE